MLFKIAQIKYSRFVILKEKFKSGQFIGIFIGIIGIILIST